VPWRFIAALIIALAALGTFVVLRSPAPVGPLPEQAARVSTSAPLPSLSPPAVAVIEEPEPRAPTRSFSLEWPTPDTPRTGAGSVVLSAPEAPAIAPAPKGTDVIPKQRITEAQQRPIGTPGERAATAPSAVPGGPARAPAVKRAEPPSRFFNVWGVGF
jgi:hypothetical protein